MKAVITVLGEDKIGIIAKTSSVLYEANVNILDISQTIMSDVFTMIMLVDISAMKPSFEELSAKLTDAGDELGVTVKIQHESIFSSMHRV